MRKHGVLIACFVAVSVSLAFAGIFDSLAGNTVKVTVVRAPEMVLEGVKTIAVSDFRGQGGSTLAIALVEELVKPSRGDTTTGIFTSREAPAYERGLTVNVFEKVIRGTGGTDAVLSGSIETIGPDDAHYQAKRIEYQGSGRNRKKIEKTVNCVKRTASLTANMVVTRVSDQSVLYSVSASENHSESRCEGDSNTLHSGSEIFQVLARKVAPKLADKIVPFYEVREFTLCSDSHCPKKIIKLAKDGKWDDAVAKWRKLLEVDAYNFPANFNIGVANEIFGNYEEALKFYQKADAIKSSKKTQEAIKRVQDRMSEVARLQGYGLTVESHQFGEGSSNLTEVRMRGDSDDRFEVYENPDTSSNVVFKIPGGMKVRIIHMEGTFVKIETFDGTSGWVLRENLDL